jgi:hypothetical protein
MRTVAVFLTALNAHLPCHAGNPISGEQKQQECLFSFQATALSAPLTSPSRSPMAWARRLCAARAGGARLSRQSRSRRQSSSARPTAVTSPWQEGLDPPVHVPGSGSLDLLAGGLPPGVMTLYHARSRLPPRLPRWLHSVCAFTTTTPALFRPYRVNLSDAEAGSVAAVADVSPTRAHAIATCPLSGATRRSVLTSCSTPGRPG